MHTNQTANLRPLPSPASLPGSLGGLPRQAEGLEGGTNSPDPFDRDTDHWPEQIEEARREDARIFVRQLLKHGLGMRPFEGQLSRPLGFTVHACLHHYTNAIPLPIGAKNFSRPALWSWLERRV